MYILEEHNLKKKDFHEPRHERIYNTQRGVSDWRFVWVDKANGRVHLESSIEDWWETEDPLFVTYFTRLYENHKAPMKRKIRNENANLPEEYQSILQVKIDKYDPSQVDGLYEKVELCRRHYGHSLFPIENKPNLATFSLPTTKQDYAVPTVWLTYSFYPKNVIIPQTTFIHKAKVA